MAGDWVEITHELPEKPEVLAIAGIVGVSRYEVLGRLVVLWRWFDLHSTDGDAPSVTPASLGAAIFGDEVGVRVMEACIEVGWLEATPRHVRVVNFDAHISESAKKRALNRRRNQRYRVTIARRNERPDRVTTEQNRTEHIKTRAGQTARPLRGTRLPPGWLPGEGGYNFCREVRPELDPSEVFEHFKDYWNAQPGAKGVKLDWQATWRNWVRRETKPRR